MSAIYLIGKTEIDEFTTTSQALSFDKLEKFVLQAQEVDLKKLLCRQFYFDILANKAGADYVALIGGDTYVDDDGVTINFLGLKATLAHLSFARYALEGHITDTAFNFVEKTSQHSQAIRLNDRRKLAAEHQNAAHEHFREVICYLDHIVEADNSKFTIYQACCAGSEDSISRLKSDLI